MDEVWLSLLSGAPLCYMRAQIDTSALDGVSIITVSNRSSAVFIPPGWAVTSIRLDDLLKWVA